MSRRLSVFLLLLLVALVPSASGQQPAPPPPPSEMVLETTIAFQLRVNGEVDAKARFYGGERQPYLLIQASQGAFLLQFGARTAVQLKESLPAEGPDGSVRMPGNPPASEAVSVGPSQGGMPEFTFGEQRFTLEMASPILGTFALEQMKEKLPSYLRKAQALTPDPESLNGLREIKAAYKVVVYFGSWCSRCGTYLPRILRTDMELSGSPIAFEYQGLDRKPDPKVQALGIDMLPGVLVFDKDGVEVGRIAAADISKPEVALAKLLSAKKP